MPREDEKKQEKEVRAEPLLASLMYLFIVAWILATIMEVCSADDLLYGLEGIVAYH